MDGDKVTAADFAYDAAAKTLTVNTDKRFAIRNTDQATVSSGANAGRIANPVDTCLVIPAGRDAFMIMEGVGIRATQPIDIKPKAALTIILGDGTKNEIVATDFPKAALHCPTGASLTIDDAVLNRTADGRHIVPEGGKVPFGCTLANGTSVAAGDPLSRLESNDPGELYAWTVDNGNAAVIGSDYIFQGQFCDYLPPRSGEPGGSMTFDGGIILATSAGNADTFSNFGAAIGGGGSADGTGPNEWITVNGGSITAQGAGHGAGIGAGAFGASGNIRINGGYVKSSGGIHASGFGGACNAQDSSDFQIVLTGGTLLPMGSVGYDFIKDVGAPNLQVTVTGGSLGNERGVSAFRFSGTAKNGKGEPVEMVQVDLTSDVGTSRYKITDWQLLVDGEPYDYGAPAEFDKGHLYLWLPKAIKENSEVTVRLTYLDEGNLDADGNPTPVTPMDLFRPGDNNLPPGAPNDGKLRRYADFELPASYTGKLTKYYDGEPFPALPLPFEAPDGRNLTDPSAITYKFQMVNVAGEPYGPELESRDPSGASQMPVNAGTMKFTAVSTQYSKDTVGGFSESYWGHRAQGKCEIKPIGSQVAITGAVWENGQPGSQENSAEKKLSLTCTVKRADRDPAGSPTKPTCTAPLGRIQLYVDGAAAGEPIEMLTADRTLPDGTVLRANTTASGDTATFTFTAAPAEVDRFVPVATPNQRHVISARYLPPSDEQREAGVPANYLASADPLEDPDGAPRAEVAIEPIDPNPTVEPKDDPDCKDPDFPAPEVSTGAGEPDDPGADPSRPGDKTFRGEITTTWGEPTADNPRPGRVILAVETPSSGPISITDADGNLFAADFVRDDAGNPVKRDGAFQLVLDPAAVGRGELTFRQEPNGAYTGSTWVYAVTVRPQPKIAPTPSVAKKAENLTHPDGPTQPGDRIRYTITAANGAAGSLWTDVVLSDPLPACLDVDERSVRLDNPRGGIPDASLSRAEAAGPGDVGKFALSAPAADGRRTLSAPAGDVAGGARASLTFECTVRADAAGPGIEPADLANVASATGTRPDPADPDGPMPDPDHPGRPLPVAPDPTGPVTPPGPGTVVPADPVLAMEKAVENVTAPGAKVTHLGDVLRYTVTLRNDGPANSCLMGAVVSDPLPEGIDPVPGSIRLAVDGGTPAPVPDAAYDAASRTIAVTAGDVWGGHGVTLTFECTAGAAALGADAANIAHGHGTVPSDGPGDTPEDPEPGLPAPPSSDGPAASTPPAEPAPIVPDDPEEGDVSIAKGAENLVRGDGTTRVGDVVRYTVTLRNDGPATGWMDAVVRDDVPEGLEPISGSVRLIVPDGRALAVDDAVYDPASRILAVAAGHLYGGQQVRLVFDALVTEEALGADIGNVATGFGTLPSEWDPDGGHPAAGEPFSPDGGWDTWERGAGRRKAVSDPAYPPGVNASGGVLPEETPGDADGKRGTTIRHKLAQTGDTLAAAALLPLAAALAAGATALASRRRRAR